MHNTLERHRPAIFVETHAPYMGGEAAVEFLAELLKLGYETKYVVDKAYNYPTVTGFNAVETIPLRDLMSDKRISEAQAVLTLFLQPTCVDTIATGQ
jgi:hypothetical protein